MIKESTSIMSADKIPFFLAIDVEPDQHVNIGPRGPATWSSVNVIRRQLRKARPALEDATDSQLCIGWYLRMDPQIEAVCGAVDRVAQLFGDELAESASTGEGYLGLHIHPTRWREEDASWVEEANPDVWLEHLRVGLDAYEARMGAAPLRHRFTRGWTHASLYSLLAKAGVRVDLTPESSHVAYLRRPVYGPYVPAGGPGSRGPWVVPANLWTPSWSRNAGGSWARSKRLLRRGPFARWHLTPFARSLTPTEFWDQAARSVSEMPIPYVSLAFRNRPEGSWYEVRQRALLESLVEHPFAHRLRFADPLDFVEERARQLGHADAR
jgi:hypothetical protein